MIFLLLLLSLNAYSFTFETLASNTEVNLTLRPFKNKKFNVIPASPVVRKNKLISILDDYKKRINNDFKIPPNFYPNTYFWTNVYANYNSNQVIIHNKFFLRLIYEVLDFTYLEKTGLDEIERFILQAELSQMFINRLKVSVLTESNNFDALYKEAKVKLPKNKKERNKNLKSLARNLRIQTGQRDAFKRGLVRSIPFQKNIKKIISEFDLPQELIAIPFLESSFNVNAKSKVGASGIWQIMPFIRSTIFKNEKGIDYTDNVYISSLGALKLFRENYNILKRWDLAITAYNSGVSHILDAAKKLKIERKDLSLTKLFKIYNNENHGFASENFYSGFLSLTRILIYLDELFPDISLKDIEKVKSVSYYVNHCPVNVVNFFKSFNDKETIMDLNNHLTTNKIDPKNILVSNVELNKNKYTEIPLKKFKYSYPKEFAKKNYRCSTK